MSVLTVDESSGFCGLDGMERLLDRNREALENLGCHVITIRSTPFPRRKLLIRYKETFRDYMALREIYSFFPSHLPSMPIEIWEIIKECLGNTRYKFLAVCDTFSDGIKSMAHGYGVLIPWGKCNYRQVLSVIREFNPHLSTVPIFQSEIRYDYISTAKGISSNTQYRSIYKGLYSNWILDDYGPLDVDVLEVVFMNRHLEEACMDYHNDRKFLDYLRRIVVGPIHDILRDVKISIPIEARECVETPHLVKRHRFPISDLFVVCILACVIFWFFE